MFFVCGFYIINGFSEDVSLAIEKAVKPTILTKDDSMADNGIIDMAPNNVINGGLD
jgi:hypothetical protein